MQLVTQARTPMLPLLLGLLVGLTLARYFDAPLPLLLCAGLIGSLTTLALTGIEKLQKLWLPSFLISAAICFWAYGMTQLPATPTPYNLSLPEREAQLTIEIQRVLQSEHYGKASGFARVLKASETSRMQTDDILYFRLKLPTAAESTGAENLKIKRGLHVQTTGVLSPIRAPTANAEGRSFDAFLKDSGVHYRFDRTGTLKTIRAPAAFDRFCAEMNERFQATLRLGAPDDSELPNVYVAMLLGRRVELTKGQTERYRMTGTMHFFAISGLHIGVIAKVIAQFLLLIRVPRKISPCVGLPMLYMYVQITGASPSAMRAFLMAMFFWSSFAFQRQRSPFAALIASAIFVLMIDPNQLWSIGFQLSYSVVASIVLFGLPLQKLLKWNFRLYRWLPKENWNQRQRAFAWLFDEVLMLFAISCSAWLASTPLSAGLFGFIVPGAILFNMVLIYPVAIVISSGVISLACASALLPWASGFINHAAWTVIFLMDKCVNYIAQAPRAVLSSEGFPPALSYTALSAYLASLLWLHHQPQRLQGCAMWLPPALIISAVAAGLLMIA